MGFYLRGMPQRWVLCEQMYRESNYSALLAESLRIQTAIKVLWGMNGFPSKTPWIASITELEFFLTVEIYPLMRQKIFAPSQLLKFPEIFCWTFIILRSLSAWLLSNGTSKSYMKAKTSLRYFCNLSNRFWAFVFFFFPRFLIGPCELEVIGGGFSSLALSIMWSYLSSKSFISARSKLQWIGFLRSTVS